MIGQFFTPDYLARAVFRLARLGRNGARVIDPAAGDGAFLRAAPAGCDLFACELDSTYHQTLRKLLRKGRLIPGDALTSLQPLWGAFDLVIGNPPYSAQAHLERRPEVLRQFDLGSGRRSQCLEILFLELFLKLAKPGGRIAIILPDGPVANQPFHYVRRWILEHARIEIIVSLPRSVFPLTTAKTNVVIAKKLPPPALPSRKQTRLFICAETGWLGKDDAKARNQKVSSRLRAFPVQLLRRGSALLAPRADWRPEALAAALLAASSPTACLGDLFNLRTGFARYGSQRALFGSPGPDRILLIRARNFSPHGGLRLGHNCAYIARNGPMFSAKAVVRPGEVLFVRVGAGCYGRVAAVPRGLVAQADDWIHVLTPTTTLDAPALVAWFHAPEGRSAVRCLAKGVGAPSVSKASLAALRIPASRAPIAMRGRPL